MIPGQEQEQGQEQRFVLELPALGSKLDLDDWNEGNRIGNGETTTCCHACKKPLDGNANTSDSQTAVKHPEPTD